MAKSNPDDPDIRMRLAAFEHVRGLSQLRNSLTAADLNSTFTFEGEAIRIANRPRGIFKPRQMRYPLSLKTVYPRHGRRIWYDDQKKFYREIKGNDKDKTVDYAFMGKNPKHLTNQQLREVCKARKPLIYFRGVAPERYVACFPAFISEWNPDELKVRVVFGLPEQGNLFPPESLRRYALRTVKQRIHQASFREAVMQAYGWRCALSGLPERRLLDAAHIVPDQDEQLGQPVVPNGLPLSKIHHAAFDANLIGINPDYRICVSKRLLRQNDGSTLEALKQLDGKELHRPRRQKDYPDRARLAQRFEQFENAS